MEAWLKGRPLPYGMPESLRLFAICQAMEWNHLPNAGGIYDQHPEMMDQWLYIFSRKGEHERRDREKRDADMKRQQSRKR